MNNLDRDFRVIELIFYSILSIKMFLAVTFYYLRSNNIISMEDIDFEYLPLLVLMINTLFILSAKYFFTARNKIDIKLPVETKIQKYRLNTILIVVLLDTAFLINLMIYLLNGSQIYLLVGILVLILFIVYRPNKSNFYEISLTSNERSELL